MTILLLALELTLHGLLLARLRRLERTPPPPAPDGDAARRAAEAIDRFNAGVAGILNYDVAGGRP